MNWKKLFPCFYKPKKTPSREEREEISLVIADEEVLVRGVLSPLFYSERKKQIRETLFLPPKGQITVSLNRFRYTTASFCKQHAKTINLPDDTYCGLASIINKDINFANAKVNGIQGFVKATPMSENKEYLDMNIVKAYVDSEGLPMHADLTYYIDEFDTSVEPKTRLRKIASEIVKLATYYHDSAPEEQEWTENTLLKSLTNV